MDRNDARYVMVNSSSHLVGLAFAPLFLMLLVASACKPSSIANLTPKVSEQRPSASSKECRPMLMRIPEETVVVQSGAWQYTFNVLLVGCIADLERITPSQREAIVHLARKEIENGGLRIMAEVETLSFRERFRSGVNRVLGGELTSDAYINILVAGESM